MARTGGRAARRRLPPAIELGAFGTDVWGAEGTMVHSAGASGGFEPRGLRKEAQRTSPLKEGRWFAGFTNAALSGLVSPVDPSRQPRSEALLAAGY